MFITMIALIVTGNALGDNFETRCAEVGLSISACRAQHEANKDEAREVLSEARERARISRSRSGPHRTREARAIMAEALEQAHALRIDLRKPSFRQ
jgi:hypothetical protein